MSDHDFSEVIQFLELETQFSTKPVYHRDADNKNEILIMDKKKAYNISILLGHLKMSVADIKKALYSMDEKTLSPDLLGQLLSFVPNEHEISQYRQYSGDLSLLTKPDQFAFQMSLVKDYEERLRALKFKASFRERVEELRKSLDCVRSASLELRNSKRLAHILEIILAMGNFMNKGNSRVGEAAGFRITFLTQFPESVQLTDDLPTVEKAAKVSLETVTTDIRDLWKTLQEMSTGLEDSKNNSQYSESGDQFQEVMSHFIEEATEEVQSLFRLQASAADEFSRTVKYYGENPKTFGTSDLFGIFSEFTKNFEVELMIFLLFFVFFLLCSSFCLFKSYIRMNDFLLSCTF
ncbi:unnamed protein product [Candidula unifasciata]|uniref:FH2 domain-containing protein n=1 Tax=Candidula unifasciata TaxID=100452 RepID=A0A8S3Z069_9EUPU|nr:unnamed protein product [Candidula unifasciata]